MADKKPKLTPKQAKFVRGIAEGKTQRQAYLDAYDCNKSIKTVDEQASHLAAEWAIRYVINKIEQLGKENTDVVLAEYSKYSQDDETIAIASKRSVYVMKCNEFYKIGIATNPRKRLNAIRTSSPYDIELITALKVSDAIALERTLHKQYADYCIRGEWFSLSEAQITEVLDTITEVANGN